MYFVAFDKESITLDNSCESCFHFLWLNMKKIFTLKRSGKDRGEEIQEISLDILLAHKDDVMTKVEN